MNVNSLILTALSPLSLPVSPNKYEGTATEYIVFNYADERPAVYADDVDTHDETSIQVHYYVRDKNPQTMKKTIRRLLRAAGFTIGSTAEFFEDDTKLTHIIASAWIDGNIDDDQEE